MRPNPVPPSLMNASALASPLALPAALRLPLGRNTLIALAVVVLHVGLI